MDVCQDALTKCPQDADEAVKKAKRQEYAAGKLKSYMDTLSGLLESSGGPFFTGKELTLADLVAKYYLIDMIRTGDFDHVAPEYVDAWPLLLAHNAAVSEHSLVKAYAASTA